jgi:FixJ family two-component response regulator
MTHIRVISVVDDDRSLRTSLKSLLRSVGYVVDVFCSGEEFLKSASLKKTDCLILDVQMPGINGLQLQKELNVQRAEIPIVFVTAHESDRIQSQAIANGAVAFLVKPLTEAMVLTAVDKALGGPQPSFDAGSLN